MSTSDALTVMLDAQVAVAQAVGSRFYERLLELMREDAAADGPTRAALAGHEHDRVDEWDGFRLLCGVHRMVLGGEADDLRAHFPSTGGDGDADAAWPAIRRLIAAGSPDLVEALAHPLQTNAPSRAKALVGAFCCVAQQTGRPLRLLELGASAGLNLRLDKFRYEQDGVAFGPADSPVRFVDFLIGGMPPLGHGFEVVDRTGCDLHPIDATTADGRLTLLACVFPDESERFGLLDRAIEVARATPAVVDRDDLASWVAAALAESRPGVTTVVYHTIVWPYLADDIRASAESAINAAGARATGDAPLALVAFEGAADDPARVETHLTLWPGGDRRLLALAGQHPTTVTWVDHRR